MLTVLRKINLVYYIIYGLTIVSAVIVFMLTFSDVNFSYIDEKSTAGITISSIYILYILISIPLALWLFHRETKKWQLIEDKFRKYKAYEKGSITRLWVVGAGLILGVVLLYLLRSQSMIFCAAMSAIALYFCKPTPGKMIKELNITDEEDV